MPIRIIGMIGAIPPSSAATAHVIRGGLPSGVRGYTTCLIGTTEHGAQAIAKYCELGIRSVLIRGFDPMNDAREYGRELIPRLRAAAAALDKRSAS